MALSTLLLICLIAGAAADSQPLNLSNLRCSEECPITSSQKLTYEIGKTYRYNYNGKSMVNINGLEQGRTSSEFTSNVHFTWINNCDVLMIVKEAKVDGVESPIMNPYPTVVSFIDGRLDNICIHPKDDAESVNMKRGIASYMQNSLPELTPSPVTQVLNEEDIIGECPTSYTVEANGDTTVVTKERDHNKCKNNIMPVLDIPLMKTQMKLYDSKSLCKQEITNGVFMNIWCKDTNAVNPIPVFQELTSATAEASLTFVSEYTDSNNLKSLADITLVRSHLNYDDRVFIKAKIVSDIDNTLTNICTLIQSQGMSEVTASVARAIVLLRHTPNHIIVDTLQKLRRREYCSNFKKLESIFLDVIAYIGKPGAISIMADEIAANRVNGGRMPIYVASLHLLNDPTEDIIMALTPILLMKNPEPTAILATASLINKYCKTNSNCMETELMGNIMKIFSKKLQTQCTVEFCTENPKEVLGNLKALSNIGTMTPEVATGVLKCTKLHEIESNIQFTAAMVLRKAPCSNSIKESLLGYVFNPLMKTEFRIASYLATINCISDEDITYILTKITHIVDTEVYYFITSHLLNLQETNWPTKRHLHDLLSSKNIPFAYEKNILKHSQNTQMAYSIPYLRSGIQIESNVIRNDPFYLPNFANLGVNINFMGSAVNIGEIGTIIENSESEDNTHDGYLSILNLIPIIDEILDYVRSNGDNSLTNLETPSDNGLLNSMFKHLSSKKIQLPKTELYAKLFDQEIFFFSLFGNKKELKASELVQILTMAARDVLDNIKNINIDTARAGQIRLYHIIPTIQGLPLTVSAEATILANINLKSNYGSKDGQFEGNLMFSPSISLQVDGYIGFGQNIKNGIKMKTVIYTTNGLSINLQMRDGKIFDIDLNLPDKIELLNIKSEVYPIKSTQKGNELKVLVTDLQDVRFARDECLGIIESFTGLNVCYKINLPSIFNKNGISLEKPVLLKLFLQKSNESIKGYKVLASFKNTDREKSLKMNIGLAGVNVPREFDIKISHTIDQNNDISKLNLDFQSYLLKCLLEVSAMDKEEQTNLIFFGDAQYKTDMGEKGLSGVLRTELKQIYHSYEQQYGIAFYTAQSKTLENESLICKIETLFKTKGETTSAKLSANIDPLTMSLNSAAEFKTQSIPGFWIPKIITIGNVDITASLGSVKIETHVLMASDAQYQSSVTLFYKDNIILGLSGAHHINGDLGNFIFDTNVGVRIGKSEWSSTTYFTYDHADHMEGLIKLVRSDNSRVFYIKLKYDKNGNTKKGNTEIHIPGIIDPIKASLSLENLDSYNSYFSSQPVHSFNIKSTVLHGNSVYLQVEGPVVVRLSTDTIEHHLDLQISGAAAFYGSHHVIHTLILSPDTVNFMFNIKNDLAYLFDFNLDISREDSDHSFQIDIFLPNYVKSKIGARVSSLSAEAYLDTIILPSTNSGTDLDTNVNYQRVKGNATINIETQELKGILYWDFENDKEKKVSAFSAYSYDDVDHHISINGDLLLLSETYSYKIRSVLASPFSWFSGDNGIEIFITLPSNAVFTWKAKCKVAIKDHILTLKPLLFIQLPNDEKYQLIGDLKLKNIQTAHNLDYNSEWILSVPGMENVKLANKFIQQIGEDSYKAVFKIHLGESVLNDVIEFDIMSDSKSGKYSNVMKLKFGASPTEIVTTIAGSSQVTDVSFSVSGSTNSLTIKLAKTCQSINLAIIKNQNVYTKLQFIMVSPSSYVFILQLPFRTVEFQSMVSNEKLIIDIYPEKSKSGRKLEIEMIPTISYAEGQLETYIRATSVQNTIDASAKYFISKLNENIIHFDMKYPVKDIQNLISIIIKELETIHQEMKNEGMFTELDLIYSNLKYIIKEIPSSIKFYINKWKNATMKILNKVKEAMSNIYKVYKTDFSLIWKQFVKDIDSYLNIAEENIILFTKPVIQFIKYLDLLKRISQKKDMLAKQYPFAYDIINDFYEKVVVTCLDDITRLYEKMKNAPTNDAKQVIKELKNDFYLRLQNLQEQLLNTKIVDIIQKNIEYFIEQYPLLYETLVKFFNHNRATVEENIKLLYKRIMDTTSFGDLQISSMYNNILKMIKDNVSWKSIKDTLRTFVKENLDFGFSNNNDKIKASLHLPISVSTIHSTWEFFTYHVPALIMDATTSLQKYFKVNVLPYVDQIIEEAPQIIKTIVSYCKTVTDITMSLCDHLSKLLMDIESFKTLQSKIQELIENYPTEIIEEIFNWAIVSVNEYTMWIMNDITDIPYMQTALKYISDNLISPLIQFIHTLVHTHEPVKVDLYYEAMCPFCKGFIVEQLYPTWAELGDIMEVGLFPFGNAKYEPAEPGWTFTCQHGPDECKANMIQACAQDYFEKNIYFEMEFVNCMESADHPAQAGANCSLSVGVDWAPIERCINSVDGQILLHDVALKQEKLQPKVKYVPWVLVNDKWSEELEDACTTNLKKVVCETYSGTRPECNEILQPKQLKTIKRTYP